MPPIPADHVDRLTKKSRGGNYLRPAQAELVGPFIPLLRSPEYMSRLQRVGEYLRYNTKLGPAISEFIILLMARQWTQQFEWYSHQALALKADIKRRRRSNPSPTAGGPWRFMSPDQEMVYEFVTEIRLHQSVSDPVYERVKSRFGEQGRD